LVFTVRLFLLILAVAQERWTYSHPLVRPSVSRAAILGQESWGTVSADRGNTAYQLPQ
jgi:hypothetical protein